MSGFGSEDVCTFGDPLISFLYSPANLPPMGRQFRFIHCADLHLGSRFKGLGTENPALAERLRQSVFGSFSRIIDAALENHVDALVISGDLYDDDNELPSTRMWLSEQLARLDVPVFICRGNHDSRTSWDSAIPYPSNVHEFGTAPERVELSEDVEIVGISYAVPHETRNLASILEGSFDRFTIACLHCDLDTVTEGYSYAPCSMSDLQSGNIDYWALGHIHKRDIVATGPYVVYPGNIQGRSFKETGPKGAYLVTVDSHRVSSIDFIETSVYHWEDLTVDITGRTFNDVMNIIGSKADPEAICRITFTGSGELDTLLRTNVDDVSRSIAQTVGCMISSLAVRTSPPIDIEARSNEKDMGAAVIRSGRELSKMTKEELVDLICQNKNASKHRDFFMSMSEEDVQSLVDDATRSILARMVVSR